MAGSRGLAAMVTMAIASMLAIQCVYGEIVCENVPTEMCAFSVSSAGMRCVLEKYNYGEEVRLQCRTSQVKVDDIAGWVESDMCVEACGVDRSSVGISSDSLMERQFVERLCSAPCYGGCPNIVDLYFNLAAAEGIFLPKLCESLNDNPRRGMFETLSSGFVSPAPGSLPPPSEPTPAPGSEPAVASEPAPGSEQVPAPASQPAPAPGSTPGSHGVTGTDKKKKKDKKKKNEKKKEDEKKKKPQKKKKDDHKNKKHDKKKPQKKDHHKKKPENKKA